MRAGWRVGAVDGDGLRMDWIAFLFGEAVEKLA
jgi:hypothetical protein